MSENDDSAYRLVKSVFICAAWWIGGGLLLAIVTAIVVHFAK